ncbi:MAG: sodium:proton antiporter [Halieaceae bacterium]|nr:sodium:proton antiporter [Halieaceae bacterium]
MSDFGSLALLPTGLVVILALWSRRSIESLLAGSLLGAFMLAPHNPLGLLADHSLAVMMNETVAWIILVCGFMGSLIALFIRTGAVSAFSTALGARLKNRRQALMATWVLGISLFVDDYLNSLAVGAAMRKVCDSWRSSREMLAYVVDSTAAPISVIIPVSTWAVFFAALLEDGGLVTDGAGIRAYIDAIPYMFYPWLAILTVPLVIQGHIPLFGALRRAEARAAQSAQGLKEAEGTVGAAHAPPGAPPGASTASGWQFGAMMLLLVASTWYFDLDFLKGIYLTLAVYLVLIICQRGLSIAQCFDTMLEGFKTMLQPLAVVVCAYLLKGINDQLGLSDYVINSIGPYLSATSLPVALFVSMAVVSFATGSSWGVFVIVMPIITSLSQNLGADITLVIGATLSAATFGSHACFYSDSTVLSAQASGCNAYQHALTQIPYALFSATIAVAAFWLAAIA